MRLFAALLPPVALLDQLEEALAPHRAAWPDLKWIRRELSHVTLAFFGETDDKAHAQLLPRLERVAGRYPELSLSFAGAGAFPGKGAHGRVLWTGIYGDRRTLARLAASAAAAGRRSGCPAGEHRGFRPHLTLARSRTPRDLRPLIEDLSAFATSSWTADSLHLMRSHLGATVHYETLETWSLSGRHSDSPLPT
ncbi:MAG: RNA 2',3'-cyclic phosphodiesterase [Solirubrobacterales bacterium]